MGKQVSIYSPDSLLMKKAETGPRCVENNVAHGHVLKHNKHGVFVDKGNKYGMLTVKKIDSRRIFRQNIFKEELLDEKMQALLGKNVNIS